MNRYCICIPVFNDWISALEVIGRIDRIAREIDANVEVILIDDGSSEPCPQTSQMALASLGRVQVLHLRRNLGHQRAIAIGLAFAERNLEFDGLIVMDGDGEDRPEDMPLLIRRFEGLGRGTAVFAKRGRRTDGPVFSLFYQIYKGIHRLLTGRRVEVGNFSILPHRHVESLVAVSELWNHYAASVVRARLPFDVVTIDRGIRIAGESKMNFVSLTLHGLYAMSVHVDVIGVRLLVLTTALLTCSVIGLAAVLYTKFATDFAIPAWATTAAGSLASMALLLMTIGLVLVFVILNDRQHTGFLPIRDAESFISGVTDLHC